MGKERIFFGALTNFQSSNGEQHLRISPNGREEDARGTIHPVGFNDHCRNNKQIKTYYKQVKSMMLILLSIACQNVCIHPNNQNHAIVTHDALRRFEKSTSPVIPPIIHPLNLPVPQPLPWRCIPLDNICPLSRARHHNRVSIDIIPRRSTSTPTAPTRTSPTRPGGHHQRRSLYKSPRRCRRWWRRQWC